MLYGTWRAYPKLWMTGSYVGYLVFCIRILRYCTALLTVHYLTNTASCEDFSVADFKSYSPENTLQKVIRIE